MAPAVQVSRRVRAFQSRAVLRGRDRMASLKPARKKYAGQHRAAIMMEADLSIQDESKPQSEYEKKKANFITRAIWTFVMIAGFFVALFSGHIYVLAIITAIQIISFKEVIAIANVPSRAKNLPFTRSLNWYFLGTTMYFLYGESVIYYFKHILLVDKVLLPFATHHRFISFVLYVMGQFSIPAANGCKTETFLQASSSLWLLFKKATTAFNSHSSPGRTWRST